jgi:hypothetical protein
MSGMSGMSGAPAVNDNTRPMSFSFSLDSSITHVEAQSDGEEDFHFPYPTYQFSPPRSSHKGSAQGQDLASRPLELAQEALAGSGSGWGQEGRVDNRSPLMTVDSMIDWTKELDPNDC